MNHFRGDDYEFAAGSILGMRSWGIDKDGRLHGVTHREVWTPGENVSVCKAKRRVPCPEVAKQRAKRERDRGPRISRREPDFYEYEIVTSFAAFYPAESCGERGCKEGTHPAAPDHNFDPTCECGFWAYNEDDFNEHGHVTGIIEGYGKTTIGTRGFRCEKARVVALCRERRDTYLTLSVWLRLQQLYPAAKFYEDSDDMVTAFGGVLKTWSAVGDDFWSKPVKSEESEALAALNAYARTLSSSMPRWMGGQL